MRWKNRIGSKIMAKILTDPFIEYAETLTEDGRKRLDRFFKQFNSHCLLSRPEKRKLRGDFEKAILYYVQAGLPLEDALERLNPSHLGGFYARPPILWFPLDDAAKIYPLSMEHGRMTLFRLSVYLKAPVVPELLQMALDFTIRRFPSFATTLKKGIFWHYLDTAKRRFPVQEEKDIPCQPWQVSLSGSQSFRVLYYGNRISMEFFHVLTDGTGGMMFLKVLTAEYLRLNGAEVIPDETLWDIGTTPAAEEFENAFAKVPQSPSASGFVDKPALQMSGRLTEVNPCRILHFKMDASALKAAAEKYQATVTEYMLGQMFLAGRAATDDLVGEMSIQVPVNMRKFYPSKTVRNFSMYCGVRIPVNEIQNLPGMLDDIHDQLHRKASKESMREMLTATERLVNTLKLVPLVIKQPVARIVYGFLGDKIFTNTLSNLGVVKFPEALAPYIDSMDFVLPPEITNRAACTLITVNHTATFSITKATVDPSFEEKMQELLQADGIVVTVEGSEVYER